MRQFKQVLVVALLIWLVGQGAASAQYLYSGTLDIDGWYNSSTAAKLRGSWQDQYGNITTTSLDWGGVGAFDASFGGNALSHPLYCLDLWHTFTWNQNSWEVDVYRVPPSPDPPYNTEQVGWLYYNYGIAPGNGTEAQAAQLALWEVSHQTDWFDEYVVGTDSWISQGDDTGGDFWIATDASGNPYINNTAAVTTATGYLDALYAYHDGGGTYAGIAGAYYQPSGAGPGQGQYGYIPEPSVMMLLGVGLISAAGLGWRRRRK